MALRRNVDFQTANFQILKMSTSLIYICTYVFAFVHMHPNLILLGYRQTLALGTLPLRGSVRMGLNKRRRGRYFFDILQVGMLSTF
jgi:hypothetical protein